MKLSVPVHELKSQARVLAKAQNIPLSDALDTIAAQEGFKTWSLLSARLNASNTFAEAISSQSRRTSAHRRSSRARQDHDGAATCPEGSIVR